MKARLPRLLLGLTCLLIAVWLVAPTLIVFPMSFADKKSLAFPPTGPHDRASLRFAVRAGVLLGLLPLAFLIPKLSQAYFVGFQNMPEAELPLIALTVLALAPHPLCAALRVVWPRMPVRRQAPCRNLPACGLWTSERSQECSPAHCRLTREGGSRHGSPLSILIPVAATSSFSRLSRRPRPGYRQFPF